MADRNHIEHRMLALAYTTDVTITAASLAYYAPCTIEEAASLLEDLAARDRVSMTVHDDGTVVYEVPNRQRIGAATPVTQTPFAAATPPLAMVHVPHAHGPSPLVAALLAFAVPGAGHLYARRVVAAIAWFVVVSAAYALILPGLFLHAFSIGSAASAAARARLVAA